MGRKTPISFNLRKYVEKHCNGPSECTAKHENKASHNTDYIVPSLAMIEKKSKRRLKKEIFIIVKNIVLTKNWFVFSNF